jgi:crotonobetainyl-CoA:carnitine CoA-transferase CaiB-like acyl-CoA transferase
MGADVIKIEQPVRRDVIRTRSFAAVTLLE